MEWINVKDELPKLKDDSVLVYFARQSSIGMVHIQDYFDDITNGIGKNGIQLYTKWYISQGVTHWMCLPEAPKKQGG